MKERRTKSMRGRYGPMRRGALNSLLAHRPPRLALFHRKNAKSIQQLLAEAMVRAINPQPDDLWLDPCGPRRVYIGTPQ